MSDDMKLAARPGMTDEVLYAREGHLGRIMLNRPKVINVLNDSMVTSVQAQLQDWAQDDAIAAVSIQGTGHRGLCAGADVRALRTAILAGSGEEMRFWNHEYRLNADIGSFPKPFVALMDGFVMGGGVGISAHGSLRLVTERSRIAMPETIIGFSPDTGGMFPLSRAPGEIGTHLAMTGLSIGGADAVACGLADALVASNDIPGIIARLAAGVSLDAGLSNAALSVARLSDAALSTAVSSDALSSKAASYDGGFGSTSAAGELGTQRDWIDSCYAGSDPVAILRALREHPAPAARQSAEVLASRSPLAVCIALEAIRRAGRMDSLAQVLEQDLILCSALAEAGDFVEGVRALLVDRDNAPRWRHKSVADVDPAEVALALSGGRPVAAAAAGKG